MKGKLLAFVVLFYQFSFSQNPLYDIIVPDSQAALVTRLIYETEDNYLLFNYRGISPLFTIGVQVMSINKSTGEIENTSFLKKNDFDEIQFNSNSITVEQNGNLRFISNLWNKIYEFNYDIRNNFLTFGDSITHPLGGSYFDYQHIKVKDTTYYHVQSFQLDDSFMPAVIIKSPDTLKFIYMDTIAGYNRLGRYMELLSNGNFLIFGSKKIGGLGQITAIEMNNIGKVISEIATPWEDNSFSTRAVLKVNEDEFIILALAYITKNEEDFFYFNLYRYNHKTKKLIWRHKENKYATTNFGADGFISKGHRANEYFYCGEADSENQSPDSVFTRGQIVKINGEGKTIWNKYYYYTSIKRRFNSFNHIIATSDGNYLAAGTSTPAGFSAWAIKIDEDGNIVPIDTSTSSLEINIPQINIYPNPASDYLIINQNEQTNINYELIDMQGHVIKKLYLQDAHQHTMWDISDVKSGFYKLQIKQRDKVLQNVKIVVE